MLAEVGMSPDEIDSGWDEAEVDAQIAEIDRRYTMLEAAAGDLEWVAPIMVVNGRYLLVPDRFENLGELLVTASAVIERERARIQGSGTDQE